MSAMQTVVLFLNRIDAFRSEGPLAQAALVLLSSAWPEAYPASACIQDRRFYCLERTPDGARLVIIIPEGNTCALSGATGFEPDTAETLAVGGMDYLVACCALSHENTDALRAAFPFTRPRPCGTDTSFGMGDRLGLATPGHIRAARAFQVFPVLAQQSIREMARTGRSPHQVLDQAAWAVFQEGFRTGYGADADHLKTEDDVRATAAAGFTMFTIDPSDYISDAAAGMDQAALGKALAELFHDGPGRAEDVRDEFIKTYESREFRLEDPVTGFSRTFTLRGVDLMRIAVTYLPAIRHATAMYALLKDILGAAPFDFEVSVDETAAPAPKAAR